MAYYNGSDQEIERVVEQIGEEADLENLEGKVN